MIISLQYSDRIQDSASVFLCLYDVEAESDFVMRAPGALHHARFLASSLYIMKLAMLADNLPRGLVTPHMHAHINRMAVFIALFHGPWFLQAILPSPAPWLDLKLWHDMCTFEVNKYQ